jgi:hypothetical protein
MATVWRPWTDEIFLEKLWTILEIQRYIRVVWRLDTLLFDTESARALKVHVEDKAFCTLHLMSA